MSAATRKPGIWGLMAEFDSPADLVRACRGAREAGYRRMPTFQGQLSEEQVIELLAYVRSLGPKQSGAVAAAAGSEGKKP